jgi:hypothetical protein
MEDVGIFNGHLVYFVVIWYITFSRFGMLFQEQSGNLAAEADFSRPVVYILRAGHEISYPGRRMHTQVRNWYEKKSCVAQNLIKQSLTKY